MTMSADLLSLASDDCTGFIVPYRSQLRKLFRITRHGWIPLWLPDIGLRIIDEGSHMPVFCFWTVADTSIANKRQRSKEWTPARITRKQHKRAKLAHRK